MARSYHLIDGYNLMHAAGLARVRYAQGDLERCRHRLLLLVSELLTLEERDRTTVVFDAREAPPGGIRRHIYRNMGVEFAEPGTEADDHIELLISTHSASRQILLVSSDHRLQRAIRRRHGRSIDSEKFLEQYAHRQQNLQIEGLQQKPDFPPARAVQEQTDYWSSVFADVDPKAIQRELPKEISESQFLGFSRTSSEPEARPIAPTQESERTIWEREIDSLQEILDDPKLTRQWLDESISSPPKRPPAK